MSTVRPPIFPTQPQAPQAQAPARSSAQQAFFQAALGRPAPAAAQPQAQPAAAPVQRMPASLPADPPSKILRPGSILDIRV